MFYYQPLGRLRIGPKVSVQYQISASLSPPSVQQFFREKNRFFMLFRPKGNSPHMECAVKHAGHMSHTCRQEYATTTGHIYVVSQDATRADT